MMRRARRRVPSIRRRFETVSRRPTAEVYDRVRSLIVTGQLAPGTRLIETELAERLGVSRTPVRQALQRLQQDGFVQATSGAHQARLSVVPLTADDAVELLEIVGALEGVAAGRAARLAPSERGRLASELTRLNADFRLAAGNTPPNLDVLFRRDEEFHRRYVTEAGRPRLLAMHEAVKPQAERYIRMYISLLSTDVTASVAEHRAIIDAIRNGDSPRADRSARKNWRHAAERLCRVIAVAGEIGGWDRAGTR